MSGAFRRTLNLLATSSASTSSSKALPLPSTSLLVSHLKPSSLPTFTSPIKTGKTLYEHLSSLPNNGIGTRVRQIKWAAKGVDVPIGQDFQGPILEYNQRKSKDHLCYWEVTRARIRLAGEKRKPHGKVWGRLVWRGVPITPKGAEERIRGGLKYSWDAAA